MNERNLLDAAIRNNLRTIKEVCTYADEHAYRAIERPDWTEIKNVCDILNVVYIAQGVPDTIENSKWVMNKLYQVEKDGSLGNSVEVLEMNQGLAGHMGVNWSACGTATVADAKKYHALLGEAIAHAEKLNKALNS